MLRLPLLYPLLRWLLRVDLPVPEKTDEEITAEMHRQYRWNFGVNMLDGASFWFGASFISAATIIPLFISKLTDSTLAIGLAAVIAEGGWYLPQLFTANLVERLPRKKPMVVNLGLFLERFPIFLLIAAALVAGKSPGLALVIFFIGYLSHGLGAGLVATSWQDLIARCFPVERRGRFLGTTMFVGAGAGALSAGFSARLLDSYPFPDNFVIIFSIAAVAILASWFFLALTREPVRKETVPRQSTREYWSSLRRILRNDHNFRHFLTARLLLTGANMGVGFVTVAAIHRWEVADSVVAGYTAAYLVGQTAGNLLFGFLADKFGHKLSLEMSGLIVVAAFLMAVLAPTPEWYYVVFGLLGFKLGAAVVSGILVVLEFCPPEKRPTYIGLTSTATGITGALTPLVGAALAGINFNLLFVVSAVVSLVAFAAMRWWVEEPRYTVPV
ncbi:MAG: MFS transporter, partial [Candidatus Promineifilaceae bacterium]